MNIEIITTPNENLKETGFGTKVACLNVLNSIKKLNHVARLNVCTTREDLEKVVNRKPDLVILAVKYISNWNGEEIWLAEYFADHNINFSGSTKETLKFDSNKVLAKEFLRKKGINTADFFTAIPGQFKREEELPLAFPLFLKPLDAANGNGVDDLSFVTNFSEFESKTLSLYTEFNLPVLVEEYLDGPEFTVAVLKTKTGELIVSPIEIVPEASKNGLRILGEKAKKDDNEIIKKNTNIALTNRVKKLAIEVFNELGIRDLGRIDIKTNQRGQCYFMEANLVPGMTSGSSYFPKACKSEHGYSYDNIIELILEAGIDRVPATLYPAITLGLATPLTGALLTATQLTTTPLPGTQLSGTPLVTTQLTTIPLPSTQLTATPLPGTPLSSTQLTATPLAATPLVATPLILVN